jgi:hypothetical protein
MSIFWSSTNYCLEPLFQKGCRLLAIAEKKDKAKRPGTLGDKLRFLRLPHQLRITRRYYALPNTETQLFSKV